MEQLKKMKECLTGMVESQIYGNIDNVDTKELGEAIDMIKDLSEAIYYCTITESMEEGAGAEKRHYEKPMYASRRIIPQEPYYPAEYYDPRYRERPGMMYAAGDGGSNGGNGNSGGSRYYSDERMSKHEPMTNGVYRNGAMRDPKEGRSGQRRKMYMDGKGMKDKTSQMQELDAYMQELASDMTEMIQDASPEEKQLLQTKLSTLVNKIK